MLSNELCQHNPWDGLLRWADLYIAQSLINMWQIFNNESKHDVHDKLIQNSLLKGKNFHT